MLFRSAAAALILLSGSALAAEAGWSGTLSSLDGGLGGTVRVVNDTTITISNYQLRDASAPALYWWGSTTSDLPSGFRINNERVSRPARTDTITIPLDAGRRASDFSTVGLWCERLNANFGQATLTKDGTTASASDGMAKGGNVKASAARRASGYPAAAVAVLGFALFLA